MEPQKPPIMKNAIWVEAREWISRQKTSTKSRGHFNFKASTPETLQNRLLKLKTKCVGKDCILPMNPIRKHRNSMVLTLHVTGPRHNGHCSCSYGNEAKAAILALQLDLGQAENSPRVQQAKEDIKNRHPTFFDGEDDE
jgi:hypothetical protein